MYSSPSVGSAAFHESRGVPLDACFVDIHKAFDTAQHDLLRGRLTSVGVQGCMLTAIRSLYASGTLSMKVGGMAGAPGLQCMGVRQGCPLSPTLFGIFLDSLHQHTSAMAPESGLVLTSGRRVPFLCYVHDVVFLSGTSQPEMVYST